MSTGSKMNRNGKESVATILLIDDYTADVLLLEKSLQARNISYNLVRFLNGEVAMRAISEGHTALPDLILVDLNLPGRHGFDVLSTVRNVPRWSASRWECSLHPTLRRTATGPSSSESRDTFASHPPLTSLSTKSAEPFRSCFRSVPGEISRLEVPDVVNQGSAPDFRLT